jgi:hypothetical protein
LFLSEAPLDAAAFSKAASSVHAKENAEAGDIHLTDAEIAAVDAAFPRGSRPATLPDEIRCRPMIAFNSRDEF